MSYQNFGVGGGQSGGGGDSGRTPRQCGELSEDERWKLYCSVGAKKRAAHRWTNRGMRPPPSLAAYAMPAERYREPSPEHVPSIHRYAYASERPFGEGSSRAAPSSLPSSGSDSNGWSSPSHPTPLPRAAVVVAADYANDSDEEHLAFEMMLRESELSREAELAVEQAEQRRAVELINARIARERAARTLIVKLEVTDLIDLSME